MNELIQELETRFDGSFDNPCESNHELPHIHKNVEIEGRDFRIFDWEYYADTLGFCPADDEVSKAITVNGTWEPHITKLFDDLIAKPIPHIVVDIGSHVGWYSTRAIAAGYDVIAIEANAEYLNATRHNCDYSDNLHAVQGWVGRMVPLETEPFPIGLMKIDIEGNEIFAIEMFRPWFEQRLVKNLIMEVSPVFNDTYPVLIKTLLGFGYRAFNAEHLDEEWTLENLGTNLAAIHQCDLLFVAP